MNGLYLTLLLPLGGAILLALVRSPAVAGWLNVLICGATFLASLDVALAVLADGPLLSPGEMFYIDAFNVYLVALTAFVGVTTAIFSRPYMQYVLGEGWVRERRLRLYHSMYQVFLATMLLALTT
ncbi:MAG: hypothetical protein WCY26_07365, partial [Thiohalobacteraceae bacterium]